jgi:hypothetical protein
MQFEISVNAMTDLLKRLEEMAVRAEAIGGRLRFTPSGASPDAETLHEAIRIIKARGEALGALVVKLDAVTEASKGVFIHAHAHGFHYDGPNYGAELEVARKLVADLAGDGSEGEGS